MCVLLGCLACGDSLAHFDAVESLVCVLPCSSRMLLFLFVRAAPPVRNGYQNHDKRKYLQHFYSLFSHIPNPI